MWSKVKSFSRVGFLSLITFYFCNTAFARTKQTSVCPNFKKHQVTQIDIFDGLPHDMALLAPNGSTEAPDIYRLGEIFDQGGFVTVRCHYGEHTIRDVQLKQRVSSCRYVDRSPAISAQLLCR